MAESTSLIIGVSGIGVASVMSALGWLPVWVLFGVLVVAGCLYNSKFFATGIAGGFASGVFSAMDWLPKWIYFTAVILVALFLAVQLANKYVGGASE